MPEQCLGVCSGFKTGEEHGIVAGRFLTVAQLRESHPDQRMKPPGGTGEVRDKVRLEIFSPDVRQFVAHSCVKLPVRPFRGGSRHQDYGPEKTADDGNADLGQIKLIRLDGSGRADQSRDAPVTDGQANGSEAGRSPSAQSPRITPDGDQLSARATAMGSRHGVECGQPERDDASRATSAVKGRISEPGQGADTQQVPHGSGGSLRRRKAISAPRGRAE